MKEIPIEIMGPDIQVSFDGYIDNSDNEKSMAEILREVHAVLGNTNPLILRQLRLKDANNFRANQKQVAKRRAKNMNKKNR